jgi:hypothetical protein
MAIQEKYRKITKTAILAATAAGPLGAFTGPFDGAAVGTIWTTMVVAMVKKSGHELSAGFVSKFVATLGVGVAAYYGGCKLATMLFHIIPGAGTLMAMGISSLMNALFTYKVAAAVSSQLENGKFSFHDAHLAAIAIVQIVCSLPKAGEIRDILDIRQSA